MVVRIVFAVAIVVGIAGWGFAFFSMQNRDDLERRTALAESKLKKMTESSKELAALVESYKRGERAAALQKIAEQIESDQSKLAAIQTELQPAQQKLAELTDKIDVSTGEVERLTSKIGAARMELETLRAGAKQLEALSSAAAQKLRTTSRARVRAGPGTGFDEVAVVPSGLALSVLETVEDGTWHKVGYIGYVHNDLLQPITED